VSKLLLEILVRELHNDLLSKDMGLEEVRNAEGAVLISDTALRCLLPKQLKKMTQRHKQMCGCETCIVVNSLQTMLNSWRRQKVRKMKAQVLQTGRGVVRNKKQEEHDCHASNIAPNNKPKHE